jgi:hypothetical protein
VDVGNVAVVLDVYAASVVRVYMRKVVEFCVYIGSCFVKTMGKGVKVGDLSRPARTVEAGKLYRE